MRSIPALFSFLLLIAPALHAAQAVTSGAGHDYQPAILRAADGSLLLAFERLNASFSGDLWLSRSTDDGASWSAPAPVIGSSANERHPALLQLGDGSFVLFYLKGTGATSSYRLYRATSADGQSFAEQGALNLGWASGGEVNPHVIRHPDGTLTLSYQRLSGGSYVAQSGDNGLSWDQQKTVIAADGLLPRIAFRPSDGRYLATYQVGPSPLTLYSKTTTDLRNWPAAPDLLADGADSHDSLPVLMPDGAFVVFYIAAVDGGPFDVFSRRSGDGTTYEAPWPQVQSPDALDVEPHPLVGDSAGTVQLYWGRSPAASQDYDIWRKAAAPVRDAIFRDGLDAAAPGNG
ncbi:sialidase family protein [Tahibacter harae]|uniref:Glycoside hydrolase n=1 Tax=Tahibacter harae TaxID=2963937 RepID=A0ABT1QTI4_9GAMM|nr:glycoside hydrolase [Tahibacter harae]